MADPLPDYFNEWQLAHWIGVTRQQMDRMPTRDVEEARTTMLALAEGERQRNQKANHK